MLTARPSEDRAQDSGETFAGEHAIVTAGNGVLVVWNAPHGVADRLRLMFDGEPIRSASALVRTEKSDGGLRFFAGLQLPAAHGTVILVNDEDRCLLRLPIDRRVVDLPGSDTVHPGRLTTGLTASGRTRLVAFLLQCCTALLKADADPEFRALCLNVVAVGGLLQPLQVRYRVSALHFLAEGPALSVGRASAVYMIGRDVVRRLNFLPRQIPGPRGTVSWLCVPPESIGATVVVAIGDKGVAASQVGGPNAPPSLVAAAAGLAPAVAPDAIAYALAIAAARPDDAEIAAVARELQLFRPAEPVVLRNPSHPVRGAVEAAVNAGPAGVFLSGWLDDRHGLVSALELVSAFGERHAIGAVHRYRRQDVANELPVNFGQGLPDLGFLALVPSPTERQQAYQYRLELRLSSGLQLSLTPPPCPADPALSRAAVLSCLPAPLVTAEIMDRCIAPATAALHRQVLDAAGVAANHWIGKQPKKPAVSVIVPLYRNLDFIRFQLASFAANPDFADAELIYVLDSPEQRLQLEHLLRGLHHVYAFPVCLLVHRVNAGFAPACNAGASVARGEMVLFLNSDVMPAESGWLRRLRAALGTASDIGIAGPKLLFGDDSLQHAGLTFDRGNDGVWFNRHYFKGYPRDHAPANRRRRVPGVTGACLMIGRALFADVGGFCQDFVIGDYEDSDLCLKVHQAGRSAIYVPDAELYHLERQSIRDHGGYSRGVACLYNQKLHHQRWADAIEFLLRSVGSQPSARGVARNVALIHAAA